MPLPVTLALGQDIETVEVESAAPQLNTTSDTLGETYPNKNLWELPISGRNYIELAALAPGVSHTPSSQVGIVSVPTSISASGSRTTSSKLLIDGVEANDAFRNTQLGNDPDEFGKPISLVPPDGVQEVRIWTNFDASFGRTSGAILGVITKSGSNIAHGSAYEFFQNDALNARNYLNSVNPKNGFQFNNFGGSMGGPIKPDRIFGFAAFDGEREAANVTSISSVPSSLDYAQALASLGGDPAVPLSRNPVVNPTIRTLFSICASSGQCPGGQSLWPQSNLSSPGDFLNSASRAPTPFRADGAIGRIDLKVGKHALSGTYVFREGRQSFPLAIAAGGFLPRTNTLSRLQGQLAGISLDSALTPNFINQLRIGWNKFHKMYVDEDLMRIGNPARTIGLQTGITSSRDFGLPQLTVGHFSEVGAGPFSNPSGRLGTNWFLSNGIIWSAGRHTVKAGYTFARSKVNVFEDVDFRGELEFASLADFLAGSVTAGDISRGTTDRAALQSNHAAYLQDTFRLAGLSFDAGLRWDYPGILHERHNLFSVYSPVSGLVVPRRLYVRQLHDFGPRIALIWDVGNRQKTVLRAGIGVFYDTVPQDVFLGQVQFNTFVPGIAYNPIPPTPVLTSRSPTITLQPGTPVLPPGSFPADSSDAWTVDRLRSPYVVSYNLNIQRELKLLRTETLQVAYVGSTGHNLLRVRDINAPDVPGGTRPFDNSALLSVAAPNRPFVVNQVETAAASSYNSVQTSYTQNPWHGWSNLVNWTWSHSIDDASYGIDLFANQSLPANSRAPGRERASSSFDTRHRLGWDSTYSFDIPSLGISERLKKGWNLSGVLTVNSGSPYHLNLGREFDRQGAFDFILRPDLSGDPFLGTSSPFRFLNLAAFHVPCTLDGLGTDVSHCVPGSLHYGSLRRNAFLGPGVRSFDMTFSKITKLSERWYIEIRGDLFNVSNSPQFASPLLPHFVASAASKGLDPSGRGGAVGTGCNTAAASAGCYLSLTNTPDSAIGNPFRSAGGPRTAQLSVKLAF